MVGSDKCAGILASDWSEHCTGADAQCLNQGSQSEVAVTPGGRNIPQEISLAISIKVSIKFCV